MLSNSGLDGRSLKLKQQPTMSDISNNANSYSRRYTSLLSNHAAKSSSPAAMASPSKNSTKSGDLHNQSYRLDAADESICEHLEVKIIFPDGTDINKKIDPRLEDVTDFLTNLFDLVPTVLVCFTCFRKPIYDLLIELSANAHLMPTNYILKLFGPNENSTGSEETLRIIEYTPNQLIGQLSKFQSPSGQMEGCFDQFEHFGFNSQIRLSSE